MTSRRQEAWYRGFLDYKLGTYCRALIAEQKRQGRDMSSQEKKLDSTINTRVNSDIEAMEKMRGELFKLALELKN